MSTPAPIEIETGPNPRGCVLLMHGLGDSGNGLVPLVQELAPALASAGPVRFVLPNAPEMPVTINGGYRMPAWYDILGPGQPEDEAGLRSSQATVAALLAAQQARGIPADRTVLAGFSQGCAMALLTGLRYPQALAGIVGLSGYLPLAEHTAAERQEANCATPIFLAHGRHDDVVPLGRAVWSRDALQQLGASVEWHDYPMGHSVCQEEIADLGRFLARVLAA